MPLLPAEDDSLLATSLARELREHADAIAVAEAGDAPAIESTVNDYDVVVLGVMLPGRDNATTPSAYIDVQRENPTVTPMVSRRRPLHPAPHIDTPSPYQLDITSMTNDFGGAEARNGARINDLVDARSAPYAAPVAETVIGSATTRVPRCRRAHE